MSSIGWNKKLYRAVKRQRERDEHDRAFAGFVTGAVGGFHQERQRQTADQLGRDAGLPAGAARYANPSVLTQAILAQRNREAESKQRRLDMEYEYGERAKMNDADNKARAAENEAERTARRAALIQELGNREDQHDRTLDQRNVEFAAQQKHYERMEASGLERERMQQGGANFREGLQQFGNTVRGIGGGMKDLAVAAMKRKSGGAGGIGLSADAGRYYNASVGRKNDLQKRIDILRMDLGDIPGENGVRRNITDETMVEAARTELEALIAEQQDIDLKLRNLDAQALSGQLATPQGAPVEGDDYERF